MTHGRPGIRRFGGDSRGGKIRVKGDKERDPLEGTLKLVLLCVPYLYRPKKTYKDPVKVKWLKEGPLEGALNLIPLYNPSMYLIQSRIPNPQLTAKVPHKGPSLSPLNKWSKP